MIIDDNPYEIAEFILELDTDLWLNLREQIESKCPGPSSATQRTYVTGCVLARLTGRFLACCEGDEDLENFFKGLVKEQTESFKAEIKSLKAEIKSRGV